MLSPALDENIRIAAETLLQSNSSLSNEQVQSPYTDISRSYSINTAPSIPAEYVISENLETMSHGRMSNIRRFFCLFVSFDLAFTGLMWLICVMINGENVNTAINSQIVHYNIHTSLFDVVLVALSRFIVLLLFYGLIGLNHYIIIALSTTLTCAFLIVKVFQYNWVNSHQPVFEVLLILTSFVISWGESWFLDFRVIPQEFNTRRYLFTSPAAGDSERAPLVRSYVQGLPSMYTESVGNFYSPLCSPEGSIYGGDHSHRRFPSMRLTREQENEFKNRSAKILQESWNILISPDWKLEKRSGDDTVHILSLPEFGKLFKLTALVNLPPRYLLEELFVKVENIPQWNSSLVKSYKIQSIDEYTDITYQISADVVGVRSRDFVNFRHWSLVESCYVIAYTATEHLSVPQTDKYIRGENGIGCWVMKPVPGESDRCQLQWILNTNLKGWIPQKILDVALVTMMLDYLKSLRKYITKLKESGHLSDLVCENV